jgi:TolB-like protein/Flp pilus assembly protein TadD
VPLVSAHTQARREGYFRLEWKLADERTHLMAEGTPFILPVTADETKERDALVPASFLAAQWTRLPHGEVPPAFAARVRTLLGNAVAGVADPGPASPRPATTAPIQTRRRIPAAVWAIGAVALAAGVFLLTTKRESPAPNAGAGTRPPAVEKTTVTAVAPAAVLPNDKSIAILPFANLSPDKENEFFADGVHIDLLTNLLNIRDLRVISAQSVSGYRGTTKRISEIARELGVAYILTGSVRRAGNTVRISPPNDKKLADIFELQSELARSIAAELKALLSPDERARLARRPTENLAAYDLYLKSKDYDWLSYEDSARNWQHLQRREALLQAAIELDSKFALAWANLAGVHVNVIAGKHDTTAARQTKAKETLDRALQLDADLPATIRSLARYNLYVLRDWERSRKEVERLLRIAPNDTEAISLLAGDQVIEGKFAEAIANYQKALRLNPREAGYAASLFTHLWRGRRFDEARHFKRLEITLRPDDRSDFTLARLAFMATGATRDAKELATRLEQKDPGSPEVFHVRALAAIWSGDLAEAIRLDQARPAIPDEKPGNAPGFVNGDGVGDMALIYLQRGDAEAARRRLGNFPDLLRADLLREPDNSRVLRYLATVEAILGNKAPALRHAEKSVELGTSGSVKVNAREVLAQVCAIVGEKDRAIDEITELLQTVSQVNIHELKVMPVYFNLRGDPRFEALVNDPKNNAPLF